MSAFLSAFLTGTESECSICGTCVPIVHIVGTPSTKQMKAKPFLHHTLGMATARPPNTLSFHFRQRILILPRLVSSRIITLPADLQVGAVISANRASRFKAWSSDSPMRVVTSRGTRVYEERGQLFDLPVDDMGEHVERRTHTLRNWLRIRFKATQKAKVDERKERDLTRRLTS